MKKLLFTLFCIGIFTLSTKAQTSLSVGDISILGYRSDADDSISFVTWVDLSTTTSIDFWDDGFVGGGDSSGVGPGGGTWGSSEAFLTWTNNTGGTISAGSVIVVTDPTGVPPTSDLGTASGNLQELSSSGDQVFAGQNVSFGGSPNTLTGSIVFGLDFNGSAGWDAGSTNTNTSGLPGVISSANIAPAHSDNGQYTGSRSGMTIASYKSLVADANNWTFNDDGAVFGALDSTDFSVVPEPSTYALIFGGIALGVVLIKRRMSSKV